MSQSANTYLRAQRKVPFPVSCSTLLNFFAVRITTKYIKMIRNERHQLGEVYHLVSFYDGHLARHDSVPFDGVRKYTLLLRNPYSHSLPLEHWPFLACFFEFKVQNSRKCGEILVRLLGYQSNWVRSNSETLRLKRLLWLTERQHLWSLCDPLQPSYSSV